MARPGDERRLFFRAAWLLFLIRLGLWLLPFATMRWFVARLTRSPAKATKHPHVTEDQIVWAVARVSHYIPGAKSCLPRALTAYVLLRREGHPSDLHIGVALDERKKLQAHAWVESQGKVVIGDVDLSRYTPLPSSERSR